MFELIRINYNDTSKIEVILYSRNIEYLIFVITNKLNKIINLIDSDEKTIEIAKKNYYYDEKVISVKGNLMNSFEIKEYDTKIEAKLDGEVIKTFMIHDNLNYNSAIPFVYVIIKK
jgi:hypothetical protein